MKMKHSEKKKRTILHNNMVSFFEKNQNLSPTLRAEAEEERDEKG